MVKRKSYWKAGLVILTALLFSLAAQAPSQANSLAEAEQWYSVATGQSAQAGADPAAAAPAVGGYPASTATSPSASAIWSGYSTGYSLNADEQQLLGLVNRQRAANHLPAFTVNLKLSYLARLRAQEMDDTQTLTHYLPEYGTPPRMEEAAGITATVFGAENIVRAPDVDSGNQALFNSPPHRANLLDPRESEIGLGVVRDRNGIWASELFLGN